jgi:radical SAM/Cys-rich protein
MQSLLARHSRLANSGEQLSALNDGSEKMSALAKFENKLDAIGLYPLKPTKIEIFQVNVGKMCNQVCKHCHVDAGPDRKEIMTRETMEACLTALERSAATTVDLTGGAPEMNPNFRWFVEEITRLERKVLVRCNLTILLANKHYADLPDFYRKHKVHVVSSLPYYDKRNTDKQRGDGVFTDSIEALKRLNAVGYAQEGSGLLLDLVYNPVGAFLPAPQAGLEADFKRELQAHFGIQFNSLYAITNMPISRFLDYLVESGNLEAYMEKLVSAFNPDAARGVMCRNTVSIGWDGYLYDCDFNQMLDMNILGADGKRVHIGAADWRALENRAIEINQHCYGCTAGSGSSCGGNTTD